MKMISPDFIVIPHQTKGLDTSARWVTLSGGRRVQLANPSPVSMKDLASVQNAANERGKSRVMQFAKPGADSAIDKQVKFTTNTTKDGGNADGTLRIEISDATTRTIYERPMAQLPQLMEQLAARGYELNTQFYRSLKNVVKAEGKWVTLPTGARIQIGGSGGQAQTQDKPQEKQNEQAKPSEKDSESTNESSGEAGGGLTHRQRVKIVNTLADKMGIDKSKIKMEKYDMLGGLSNGVIGVKAGQYDPADGKITLYPSSFSKGKEELIGTLAHENMHAKVDKVFGMYNQQQKMFQAGESLTGGNVEVYKELKPVFQEENRITFANANGQSKYDTQYWNLYKQEPTTQHYTMAVNETLAEVERLHTSGQSAKVNQQWNRLWRNVNTFAKETK